MARLMTAEQVCEEFGVPSPRTVKTMRQQGLVAVRLGRSYLFDADDVATFIQARKTCPASTEVQLLNGGRSEGSSTSSGSKAELDAGVQRAQAIADMLKKLSRNSSGKVINPNTGRATLAA